MAFEYFLYTTLYNNTLVDRGANSFAPLPPNTGQIYINFLIPETQPLYYYRESGGTIVLNDEETINNFLIGTEPPPEPTDNVYQYEFTGYTAQTQTQFDNLVAALSGVSTGITINEIGFHTDASAALTLTNQTLAEQFLINNNRNIKRFDLTNALQVKLSARVVTASASVNNPRIVLKYYSGFTTTVSTYLNIGVTEVSVPLTPVGVNESGWINIVNAAKGNVYLTVTQIGGDGAADPALGGVYIEVKSLVKTAEVINQGISEEIFTGYTAQTQTTINSKIDKVTGATDFIPQFISNGNIISSGYKISDLTGSTSGDYLPLSGGTNSPMSGNIFFDADDGLSGRENVATIGLGDENALTLSATTILSLDSPAIQFKNASASGFTGSILTIGKDGFINYTALENNDVEYIDTIPNVTAITDTNEHTIFNITIDSDFDKGYVEWLVNGNLPYWRNLYLRAKVNGVLRYEQLYTNQWDYSFSFSVPINTMVNSGDTIELTVQSDVANYYVYGDFLKVVKYGIKAGVYWGSIGDDINKQTDLIDKFNTKLNITDFTGYTATTEIRLDNIETNIDSLSAVTSIAVTGVTQGTGGINVDNTNPKNPIISLNGSTYVSAGTFNTYTGNTQNQINYISGVTSGNTIGIINLQNNKVNRSGDTITGDLKIEGSLYVTGITATTEELSNSVLLGALTLDGRIVATNTPALNVSENVTDITGNTVITELSGIYYVDTSSGNITIQVPDASPANDVSKLTVIKKTPDTNLVFVTTTGGTQYIGNALIQSIGQQDKGIGIVSDADNGKWLITQDSRFPSGNDEGTLLAWDNTDKVWKSTTNDVTWDRVGLKFNVGGNSMPQTFQVDATQDIVYINTTGLTGIVGADDLGFYAGGRGAFGNAVTINRLRANAPSNQPRSLSLIDTNAVMRIWRYVNDANDPAVEFVWGTGNTLSDVNNNWWDMFLDGATGGNDSFSIRRRTGGADLKILNTTVQGIQVLTTTTSSSPTTGALQVAGGAGINGDLYVGQSIRGVTLFENSVSLVNKYLQTSNFNIYSGATATAIGLKANILSPTFTGIPAAPTASANTNTTQLATTAFVVGQAANVNPLMSGTVAIGTSLRYARQDHVHPVDTSRFAVTGGTITGAVNITNTTTSTTPTTGALRVAGGVGINENLNINGITKLGNVTPDVNQQNFTVIDNTTKKLANSGTKFHVYGSEYQLAQSLGTSTTTSGTQQTKVTLTTTSLPAGTYKIFVNWVGTSSANNNDMLFDVTLNGSPLGTRTTINIELQDATTYLPLTRTFYQALSGINTILLRYWSEGGATTTISDANIELIRVS